MTTRNSSHSIASSLTKSAFDEYSRLVFFVLRKMGLNECDVAEHSQETFLRYFRHCHTLEVHCRKAWLVTTARNLALDSLAKSRRRKTEVTGDGFVDTEASLWNDSSAIDKDRARRAEQLMVALESSPKSRRYDVLKAFYVEGRKVRDIATTRKLRVSSVTSALSRQRARFREDLALHAK